MHTISKGLSKTYKIIFNGIGEGARRGCVGYCIGTTTYGLSISFFPFLPSISQLSAVCLSLSVNPGHVRMASYLTVPFIGVTDRRCKIKKRKLANGSKTGLPVICLSVCLSLGRDNLGDGGMIFEK